jgi:hypothetical protein
MASRPTGWYVEGLVEGCLERLARTIPNGGEDPPGEWEGGDQEMVLEMLKAECEVRRGRHKR